MDEGSGNNKTRYLLDGEDWSCCADEIDELLEKAPQLLSDKDNAILIRKSFKDMETPEGFYYDGWRISGKCAWLRVLMLELEIAFEPELTPSERPLRWCEKLKGTKSNEYRAISKQIKKLAELLEGMNADAGELMLSAIAGNGESKLDLIELLAIADNHIKQLAKKRTILEDYVDSELRKPKQSADKSKGVGLPVEVRWFIKATARELVNHFGLAHVPNTLIAAITNLKYENFYTPSIVVDLRDVENLTRDQDFKREFLHDHHRHPKKTP